MNGSRSVATTAPDDPHLPYDNCHECGLPAYRCDSEGGQMLVLVPAISGWQREPPFCCSDQQNRLLLFWNLGLWVPARVRHRPWSRSRVLVRTLFDDIVSALLKLLRDRES